MRGAKSSNNIYITTNPVCSTTFCSPPTPTIIGTGTMRHYLVSNAYCDNKTKPLHPVHVHLLDGHGLVSSHTAEIKLPHLPHTATHLPIIHSCWWDNCAIMVASQLLMQLLSTSQNTTNLSYEAHNDHLVDGTFTQSQPTIHHPWQTSPTAPLNPPQSKNTYNSYTPLVLALPLPHYHRPYKTTNSPLGLASQQPTYKSICPNQPPQQKDIWTSNVKINTPPKALMKHPLNPPWSTQTVSILLEELSVLIMMLYICKCIAHLVDMEMIQFPPEMVEN